MFTSNWVTILSRNIVTTFVTEIVGQGPLIEASRTHSDTSHSVGRLWISDQPIAATSTWDHTTLSRDRVSCPQRDWNPQSQQPSGPRTMVLDRVATRTSMNGVGPIGLTYPCYNCLFYGMPPTSKSTTIATQICPEK